MKPKQLKVSYIDEINSFERWLETNYLPPMSQLLWYKLIALFNRCGWSEWVTVDNHRLMGLLKISREATFIEVRNKLLEGKLLEFQKGKKSSPNRYKMNYFGFKLVVQTEVQTVVYTEVQTEVQTVDINRLDKTKTINKEINKEILDCYEENIGFMSSSVCGEVSCFLENGVLPSVITEAIKKAKSNNAPNWGYAKSIVNSQFLKQKQRSIGYDYSDKEGSL